MVGLAAKDLLSPNSSQSFNIQSVHFAPALESLAATISPAVDYDLDDISDNDIGEGTACETLPSDSNEFSEEPQVTDNFEDTEVFRGPSGSNNMTVGV